MKGATMHTTIFTKISIWQVLGAIILFPSMLFLHIWEYVLFFTRDLVWSLFLTEMLTWGIMSVLYMKLFFGVGWLEALQGARGTIFFQFFLSVVFIFTLTGVAPAHLSESNIPETILIIIAANAIYHGVLFIGLLAFASVVSIVDREV